MSEEKKKNKSEIERAERFLGKVFVLGESKYSKDNIAELLVAYRSYIDCHDSDIEAIIEYINKHKLWAGGHERDFVYRRNYLYKYVRERHGYTYRAIGEMFGGIRLHDDLMSVKDPIYLSYTSKLRERFSL